MYQLDTPLSPIVVFLRSSDYSSVLNDEKNDLRFDLNIPIQSL